jgi:hypothetical protein
MQAGHPDLCKDKSGVVKDGVGNSPTLPPNENLYMVRLEKLLG